MIKHYNIIVQGRVQGVSYRYSAFQKAQDMNILGFVKNLPNKSVEIEAEGEEETLDQFYLWCKEGPTRARVDKINLSETELVPYNRFEIR